MDCEAQGFKSPNPSLCNLASVFLVKEFGERNLDVAVAGWRGPSQIESLARQGSLYNLTLNEVESHLGEPLHSMNLDELLKSVLPIEMNQSLPAMDESSTSEHPLGPACSAREHNYAAGAKQEDIWRDIQQGGKKGSEEGHKGRRERQTTLGEMTLEDFLVKAGVVTNELIANVGQGGSADPMAGQQDFTQGGHWYQQGVMGVILYSEGGQMSISSQMMGALSDSQMPGRKRAAAPSEDVEDKLAYTNELENKVSRLEEENERLKKQKMSLFGFVEVDLSLLSIRMFLVSVVLLSFLIV
ncbi:ABSCISIC ACID-INSENSITIVE 5-like protein 2, partial [Ananas comosus]